MRRRVYLGLFFLILLLSAIFFHDDGSDFTYLGTQPDPPEKTRQLLQPILKPGNGVAEGSTVSEVASPMVSGRVFDRDTGEPLAGARVWYTVYADAVLDAQEYVLTDNAGVYHLPLPPRTQLQGDQYYVPRDLQETFYGNSPLMWYRSEHEWFVKAEQPGYAFDIGRLRPRGDDCSGPDLGLAAIEEVRQGVVVDDKDNPMADVGLVLLKGRKVIRSFRTDENGSFEFDPLPQRKKAEVRLWASKEGYVMSHSVSLNIRGKLKLMLSPICQVSGRVLDRNGQPISKGRLFYPALTTDEAGYFQGPVARGKYKGKLKFQNYYFNIGSFNIEGSHMELGDVVVKDPVDFPVRVGQVLDPTGKPLAGAKIVDYARWEIFLRPIATSNDEGSFQLQRLGDQERVWATHPQYGITSTSNLNGPMTLAFKKAHVLTVRVSTESGSVPIQTLLTTETDEFGQAAVPDDDGFANFKIPTGKLANLSVLAPGFNPIRRHSLGPFDGDEELDLTLKIGSYLEGHVYKPDGTPCPFVNVSFRSEDNRDSHYDVTDNNGFYRLDFMKPGTWEIYFGHRDYNQTTRVRIKKGGHQLNMTFWDPLGPRAFLANLFAGWFNTDPEK